MKIVAMGWTLLAIVLVGSTARQASAEFRMPPTISTNCSIEIGKQRLGFTDWSERKEGAT
jgi:hypothetical protein